ncbi:hypothetical protein MPSEU_000564900 [Mayamaea pseudoterrestris]|nr:hypothetical protein MPSEU_000564900 [Mayamaea pseudoterrestris]
MLEEALRDEKYNPNETAIAVLDFLNDALPMGGAAAEARFCKSLFVPLCDRVFGPLICGSDGVYRHKDSAWLATPQRWRMPINTEGPQSPQHRIGNPKTNVKKTWKDDPVVRLLDVNPLAAAPKDQHFRDGASSSLTLLTAISGESENRPSVGYSLDFPCLPKQFQSAWIAAADWERMSLQTAGQHQMQVCVSDNEKTLFLELLRFKPSEQHQLIAFRNKMGGHQRKNGGAAAGPFQIPAPSLVSSIRQPFVSPSSQRIINTLPPTYKDENDPSASPTVRLGMLEYYFFVFLHFGLAPPQALTASPGAAPVSRLLLKREVRRFNPHGQMVYLHLFKQYCRHFLSASWAEPHDTRSSPRKDSELFLRLVIALWIESQACLQTTESVVAAWREKHQRRLGIMFDVQPPNKGFDLDASYELTVGKGGLTFFSSLVKECISELVQLVLSQPKVHFMVQSYCEPATSMSQDKSIDDIGSHGCLTDAMTTLQLPIYNYVRAALRFAPIHNPNSTFFAALDVWLNWIEPWKYVANGGSFVSGTPSSQQQPRLKCIQHHNNRMTYDQRQWEPYVAVNLCVYTVPLALFLRRARELDFSAHNFQWACRIVSKVFVVFTPELIGTISRLLRGDTRFAELIDYHLASLGPFAPPNREMNLSACQSDMRLLLEEMHMHHSKRKADLDFFERLHAKLVGGGTLALEERSLLIVFERATLLVNLPDTYQIFPGRDRAHGSDDDQDTRTPARTKEGMLTEEGRERLLRGEVVCSPLDVQSDNELLDQAVIGSYEFAWLVTLFVSLSIRLNKWLGFSTGRINLRFLADYRNLSFCCVFGYVATSVMLLGWIKIPLLLCCILGYIVIQATKYFRAQN